MGRPYIGFGPGGPPDFGGRRYSLSGIRGLYCRRAGGGTVIDESDLIPSGSGAANI